MKHRNDYVHFNLVSNYLIKNENNNLQCVFRYIYIHHICDEQRKWPGSEPSQN